MGRKYQPKPDLWFRRWATLREQHFNHIRENGLPSIPFKDYPRELITPEYPLFAYRYAPRKRFETDDYHAWVEDDDGNVIYDPEFIDKLSIGTPIDIQFDKPVYEKWNESERRKVKTWFLSYDETREKYEDKEYVVSTFYDTPKYKMCLWNATAYVYKHQKGTVVFGSKGYKCETGGEYYTCGSDVIEK